MLVSFFLSNKVTLFIGEKARRADSFEAPSHLL